MTIQINTNKSIQWSDRQNAHFSNLIKEELSLYDDHITRVEAHLSDENGPKEGNSVIRCLLEVRIEGRQPIAASNQTDTIEAAVSGALNKINASLKSHFGRVAKH